VRVWDFGASFVRMKARVQLITATVLAAFLGPCLVAEQTPSQRLKSEALEVISPSARVRGTPGEMTVQRTGCRTLPAAETRRRIVNIALQEWAFFGFSIVKPGDEDFDIFDARYSLLSPEDSARVASSIAGYWAATPQGSEIVAGQNRVLGSTAEPLPHWAAVKGQV